MKKSLGAKVYSMLIILVIAFFAYNVFANLGLNESKDLIEVIDAVKKRFPRAKIGLHGLSMGANLPKFRKDAIDRAYLSLSETVAP